MRSLEDIKQTIIQCKPRLQERYQVTQLGLFGSYVRGEQTEASDLDVLVEFAPEARFGLFKFCELKPTSANPGTESSPRHGSWTGAEQLLVLKVDNLWLQSQCRRHEAEGYLKSLR